MRQSVDALALGLRFDRKALVQQVSDMNFVVSANHYSGGDRLRYEKAMLDDWFDKRFSKR